MVGDEGSRWWIRMVAWRGWQNSNAQEREACRPLVAGERERERTENREEITERRERERQERQATGEKRDER